MKPESWKLPQLDWSAIDAVAAGRRVVADSRQVRPGDVFLAFRGEYADGRKYIADAIAAGSRGRNLALASCSRSTRRSSVFTR